MRLIKFNSTEKLSYTRYKEMEIDNDINGTIYHETVKTGIPESVRTEYKIYWIPESKINQLTYFDRKYMVNDIVVDKENFESVLKQLGGSHE